MAIKESSCCRCSCCACSCDECGGRKKTHGEVRVVNEFRDNQKSQQVRNLLLEAVLESLPALDGLERWEVNSERYGNCVVGVVSGKTLHEFTAYVRRIGQLLGPPERFEFDSAFEDRAPDFKARWVIRKGDDPPEVHLRSERPECKMDPRTAYKSPEIVGSWEHPKIHPECLAALESLKDQIENDYDADGLYQNTVSGYGHRIGDDIAKALDERATA